MSVWTSLDIFLRPSEKRLQHSADEFPIRHCKRDCETLHQFSMFVASLVREQFENRGPKW